MKLGHNGFYYFDVKYQNVCLVFYTFQVKKEMF